MIYVFSYLFPVTALAIAGLVLVMLVKYVIEIQQDIHSQR